MFNQNQKPQPKQEKEDCEIEIKNTSQGKKIRFKGKCGREEISVARERLEE